LKEFSCSSCAVLSRCRLHS